MTKTNLIINKIFCIFIIYMIYNIKTKQKIQTSQSMIQLYGSITEFIKSISLFEYQPNNWIIGENNINYFLYVDSIDVERQIFPQYGNSRYKIRYKTTSIQNKRPLWTTSNQRNGKCKTKTITLLL